MPVTGSVVAPLHAAFSAEKTPPLMLDQIIGIVGQLQEANANTKKLLRIRKIDLDEHNNTYTILADEDRKRGLLTPLLEVIGLLKQPFVVESKLDQDGFSLVFFEESPQNPRRVESEVYVSRAHLVGCVSAYERPSRNVFVFWGLATIFTLIGPVVAYMLYKKQRHSVSFGFDNDGDVGLVLTFVGNDVVESQARQLMSIGKKYLCATTADNRSHGASQPVATAMAGSGLPKELECRIRGKIYQVTKPELIQMARDGRIGKLDEVRRPGQAWIPAERVNGLFQ